MGFVMKGVPTGGLLFVYKKMSVKCRFVYMELLHLQS